MDSRLDDLNDGNCGLDIPGHRGIPQGHLQGIQPGVLQIAQVGYRLGCLLSEGHGQVTVAWIDHLEKLRGS